MSRPGGAAASTAELTSEPVRILITASFAADRQDELNVDNSDRSTLDASRCSPRNIWGGRDLLRNWPRCPILCRRVALVQTL